MTKITQVDKLLALLSDNKWHTANELTYTVGHRFGDAIHKARKLGYDIDKRTVNHNEFQYQCLNTNSTKSKQTELLMV